MTSTGQITLNGSDNGFVSRNTAFKLYFVSAPVGNIIDGNRFDIIETTTGSDINDFYRNHCETLTLGNPSITNSCEFYFNTGALLIHND